MATRNIPYGSASAAQKDAEHSQAGSKDTHSVSKRCEDSNDKMRACGNTSHHITWRRVETDR